jgi:hypothetical protein
MAAFARQYEKNDKQKPHRRIKKAQQYANYDKTFVYLGVICNPKMTDSDNIVQTEKRNTANASQN